MNPAASDALNVLNTIVTSDSSKEIVDAIKDAFYTKALDKLEDVKRDKANDMLFGKKSDEMQYVDAKLPKAQSETGEKARQNEKLLKKTGESEDSAGSVEVDAYPGPTPQRGASGWMNPKGVPQKAYSGDRRPGVGQSNYVPSTNS